MPVRIDDQTFYSISEACWNAGISQSTLFRWIKMGIFDKGAKADIKEWRLFTEAQMIRLKEKASRLCS